MPEAADSNFRWTEFVHKTNSVLFGNLGNFINRALTLAKEARLEKKLIEKSVEKKVEERMEKAKNALQSAKFKAYLEEVLLLADFGNKYFSKAEPWKDKDHDATDSFKKTMTNCVYITLALQALIKQLLPEATEKLEGYTGVRFKRWPEKESLKNSIGEVELKKTAPLFQKIDPIRIEQELAKLSIV